MNAIITGAMSPYYSVMYSWRAGVAEDVQSDLDVLLAPAMDFAERALNGSTSIHPFGIGLTLDDQLQMLIEDRGTEVIDGSVLVRFAEEMLVDTRQTLKSCALVLDTRLPLHETDAVEMRLEHSSGVSLTIHAPYRFAGFRKRLTFGDMIVSPGVARIWTAQV